MSGGRGSVFELLQGVNEVLQTVFWDMKICVVRQPFGGQNIYDFFWIFIRCHRSSLGMGDRYGSILISGEDEVPVVIDMMNANLVGDDVGRIACGSHLVLLAKLVNSISNV